jgi:hypothetical protein
VAVLDKVDALRSQRQDFLQLTEKLLQSVFIHMFGDPQTNPKNWPETTVGEILSDGPQNGLYQPRSDYGSGTRILRIDGFYDGTIENEAKLKRLRLSSGSDELYRLREGDVVINRVNSLEFLGKSAVVPKFSETVVFESNIMRMGINKTRVIPRFLVALLQTPYIKSQVLSCAKKAVNQASINQTDVKGLRIFEPPMNLQREYVRRIEHLERLRKDGEDQKIIITDFCISLQQRAFQGELDLSRLILGPIGNEPVMVEAQKPITKISRSSTTILFKPSEATEITLNALDEIVSKGGSIEWSEDYFKYRILGMQSTPFSFSEVMEKAESIFEDPPYEKIKDMFLELLGYSESRALLNQRFDLQIDDQTNEVSGRKEIVFEPV